MSKHHESLKSAKKKPLHTPKEKRAAKMEKKHPRETPLIVPVVTH